MEARKITGGALVVKCLEAMGTEYVFGIPGAKVDSIFNALIDSKIKLILCRHEQNAAFMAASYGQISGKPGVVLVTSGPGVTNLTTGLLTATTESYPIIAIGANVEQSMQERTTHQVLDNQKLMSSVCKLSVEIHNIENIPEQFMNAYRIAVEPIKGASFISIPQDILLQKTSIKPLNFLPPPPHGHANLSLLEKIAQRIQSASNPVLFLGMNAPKDTQLYESFLTTYPMTVVSTFQGSGLISSQNFNKFAGRVGLFKNQPGDYFLAQADLIITVGLNTIEYDPEIWSSVEKNIIHLGYMPCRLHSYYQPLIELRGDIHHNLQQLSLLSSPQQMSETTLQEIMIRRQESLQEFTITDNRTGIHPLHFINCLKNLVNDQDIICCDIGSHYMWMARYFYIHQPNHLLFSNGQQTLGVGLPWAIGAKFANPKASVISISGDGGFLFSAMELETAVREKIKLIHFIWTDGAYDMVKEQALLKYGRATDVKFSKIDVVSFAKTFGAEGYVLENIDEFSTIFAKARKSNVPVLIDVKIDYQDNPKLFVQIHDQYKD
ncbi:MAG: acetolactate synthase AlsS [Gammaproteobacteria bacterium]|nr:acetolactate synthase AlsS [Gammaproteobacteria bacterium]